MLIRGFQPALVSSALLSSALLSMVLVLAGCSTDETVGVGLEDATSQKSGGPRTAQSAEASRDGIQWFEGEVDAAFALAEEDNKPLFLYWGAEWCPYCKELEATVFVRDEFIKLSHQFVALDLSNGNSETIRYADRFKLYGLPTVIVFNPEGDEVTRIRGGTNLEDYASILELTLNEVRPVATLVEQALAGEELPVSDWQLLASYSWSQDRGRALGEEDPLSVMMGLWEACPAEQPASCSALAIDAFGVWMSGSEEEAPDPKAVAVYLDAVDDILADEELAKLNLTYLAVYGSSLVDAATDERATALQSKLLALYRPAVEDASRGVLERANILSGWTETAATLLDEEESLPDADIAWAAEQADGLLAALGKYELHAGVNQLWGVYYLLDQEDAARATLQIGIERSRAPFYFMSGMAYIERSADNPEAAIEWYRKAWEATSLPLDRARWGGGYISRLTTLTPDETAEIDRAATALLADMTSQKGGLANYEKSFQRLSNALLAWAEPAESKEVVDGTEAASGASATDQVADAATAEETQRARGAVIAKLKAQMTDACADITGIRTAPTVCEDFLAPETEEEPQGA